MIPFTYREAPIFYWPVPQIGYIHMPLSHPTTLDFVQDQLLKTVRLYERVAGAIRNRIVAGELSLGQKLPTEREIAANYGVCRNVVREAIRTLTNDGLIDVRHGSGAYIADGAQRALSESLGLAISVRRDADSSLRLLEIRQLVEPGMAALAAERATSQDLELMRHELSIMDAEFKDADIFVDADHRFHLAIARAAGNYLLPLMLKPVVDLLQHQRKQIYFLERSATAAQDFHKKIFAEIERCDIKAASEMMQAHLKQVSDDIGRLPQRLTDVN